MYNKVTLVGNLGQDPEIKYTGNGTAVANASLATNEKFKNDDGWQEKTTWHKLVMWDKIAENAGEYLHKGDTIVVEGKLINDEYEKDGVKVVSTKIQVSHLRKVPKGQSN